jgi:adenosylhomocysteine nucleosidase
MTSNRCKVAIVAALEREVRRLIKVRKLRPTDDAASGLRFFEEADTVVVCGGIGAEAARRAAERVIAKYSPTIVYSVGFAGALDSGLKVGDVVQPVKVIDAGDGSRVDLREGNGVLVSFGSVASPEQKAKLKESFGAQMVDMEAAAVARAAQARGVEFASVKAVSDGFDFTFPEIERFVDSQGRFHEVRFAMFAVLRPWLWMKVWRLAMNSDAAAAALGEWLVRSMGVLIERAGGER